MMTIHNEFELHEKESKQIKAANERLLCEFGDHLEQSGLAESTVCTHVGNIDFYINEFLLNYEAIEARSGIYLVEDFLSDWFIRKAMWSNPWTVKRNATSLKKFYTFLHSEGQIDHEELEGMKRTISENIDHWAENAKIGNCDF